MYTHQVKACDFKEEGCQFMGYTEDLATHYNEQCEYHKQLVKQSLKKLENSLDTRITNLNQQNSYLKSEVNEVRMKISLKLQPVVDAVVKTESAIQSLQEGFSEMALMVQTLQATSYGGVFVWKIPEIQRRRYEAKIGKTYSVPFYSSCHRYKVCLRLYMDGDGSGVSTRAAVDPVLSTAQLPQVLLALEEVVKWKELLIHLGMPPHVAETIEQDHRGDIARQKMEGLLWWLRNKEASWEALVGALQRSGYKALARRLFDKVQNHSTDFEPEVLGVFKIWRIARKYTALMARKAFETIIKQPLDLIFKRKFKTRGKGEEKQTRWWIEVKGDQQEMRMLHTKKREIEQMIGCHLEAKSC